MAGSSAFPHGALLVEDERIVAMRGSETVVHFVIPMPSPVDVPDGWSIRSCDPVAAEDVPALPKGAPQRRLRCLVEFFHDQSPMQMAAFDLPMRTLRERVIGRSPDTSEYTGMTIPTEHWTLAHLVMLSPPEPGPEVLSQLLDDALEDLRKVQTGLWVATGRHSLPVGVETLPVLVPYLVRTVDADRADWDKGIGAMVTAAPWKLSHAEPPTPVTDGTGVYEAMDTIAKSPEIFHHRRFHLAAVTQMSYGDYHAAVLSAATSAESLFDLLLSMLLWEEGRTPEESGVLFIRSLDHRLTRELSPRLAGDWDPYGSGLIARWSTDIRRVRNAAVHRGVEPTRQQAHRALATLIELSHGIGQILGRPEIRERYPRTTYLYAPYPAHDGSAIARLLADPREPDWVATLSRWIQERDVVAKACRGWPIDSPEADVQLVVLIGPVGVRWAVWRRHDRIAVLIPRPEGLSEAQDVAVDRVLSTAAPATYCRFTILHPPPVDVPPIVLRPKGSWLLQHHVIPDRGVMVDPDRDLLTLKKG